MDAVASSPCICDQSSTVVLPVPNVTDRIARPWRDLPISSLRNAPAEIEGSMARQYASCVNRRVVIAATRYCSATRRP
jgi:hypothetical protein